MRFEGKCEIGFFFFFVEMLLSALRCINFTISLSKSLIWHVLIGWCKLKGSHPVFIEFNFLNFYNEIVRVLTSVGTKLCKIDKDAKFTQYFLNLIRISPAIVV